MAATALRLAPEVGSDTTHPPDAVSLSFFSHLSASPVPLPSRVFVPLDDPQLSRKRVVSLTALGRSLVTEYP